MCPLGDFKKLDPHSVRICAAGAVDTFLGEFAQSAAACIPRSSLPYRRERSLVSQSPTPGAEPRPVILGQLAGSAHVPKGPATKGTGREGKGPVCQSRKQDSGTSCLLRTLHPRTRDVSSPGNLVWKAPLSPRTGLFVLRVHRPSKVMAGRSELAGGEAERP